MHLKRKPVFCSLAEEGLRHGAWHAESIGPVCCEEPSIGNLDEKEQVGNSPVTSSQMGPRVGFSRISLQHPDEKGWLSIVLPYFTEASFVFWFFCFPWKTVFEA